MRDQVDTLLQAGVRAACLNSTLAYEEVLDVEARLRAGGINLFYAAPERLLGERTLALLDQVNVALFAIDEAHCLSQWGHDFRPEYLQLSVLHERFPSVPRIALTATADEPTRREIRERLDLHDARVFIAGFDRPNHPLPGGAQAEPPRAARAAGSTPSTGGRRDRLLPVTPAGRRDRGLAA